MTRTLAALFLSLSALLGAEEMRLAILGNIPETKSIESMAARFAVDAANAAPWRPSRKAEAGRLPHQGHGGGALEAAQKLAEDPQVLGVVVHGEEGADPQVLKILSDAGLPVVMASSWASARPLSNTATWLSPTSIQLAEIAALYARKGRKAAQAAVIDNGAPTASAAAKAFSDRFRELGGRVDFDGEWQGTDWGLTRTVKALKANWPQVVFFAGEGREAGVLIRAMRKERELKASNLIGLPTLFDPDFINEGRTDTKLATVVFPSPEYRSTALFLRSVGLSFAKNTPNWKAYVGYSQRAGRWSGMVFDGAQLLIEAMERASAASAPQALSPAAALSATAQAASATAAAPGEAPRKPLTRQDLVQALNGIASYKGIRGIVKFNPSREPAEAKAMIFYALPRVNTKEMRWYDKQYGPPFQ